MRLDPAQLLALLPSWLVAILVVIGMAGPAVLGVLKLLDLRSARLAQDRIAVEAAVSSRADRLIDQLQEETARAHKVIEDYLREIDLLRHARWSLEEAMGELRDAATAARVMVHELERQAGRTETVFAPLPRVSLPRAPPG